MPRTLRFHLDECCDPRIAAGLRLHGIEVTTAQEHGLRQASDETHLAWAAAENRVIITQDADFLRAAASGVDHPGIAYYQPGTRNIGQVVKTVRLLWELLEPEELQNVVEFL